MTMLVTFIIIYVVLVFIAYGMAVQSAVFDDWIDELVISAVFTWLAVPFLVLITLGKWICLMNDKLNDE